MNANQLYGLLASEDSLTVAPLLLGCIVETAVDGATVRLQITEVEAYGGSEDPASHAFRGHTARNGSMFLEGGHLYVYRSYGIHWCANVVTGAEGNGQAVLIRAGEVLEGAEVAVARRGRPSPLASGPGMLTQALGVAAEHDGHMLAEPPVRLLPGGPVEYVTGRRIGISRAKERPWRFLSVGS